MMLSSLQLHPTNALRVTNRLRRSQQSLISLRMSTTTPAASNSDVLNRGPRHAVSKKVQSALLTAFGDRIDPMVVPAGKPEFGDYQCNVAMALSKKLKQKPHEIATKILETLDAEDVLMKESLSIAGPGFINMKLDETYIKKKLIAIHKDKNTCGVTPYIDDEKKRIVVDFSSPNIAKEMHVGHLRSTIIGDSLSKILSFLGHDIVRINHVGDWGTQFGMLIRFLKENHKEYFEACISSDFSENNNAAMEKVPIKDLVQFYKAAKKRFDEDKEFEENSRAEVVKLQARDAESLKAWQAICHVSRKEFQKIYDMLRIDIEERGESFYNDMLPAVVQELENKNVAIESEGATCVFLDGYKNGDGTPMPLIIRKSDGGFLYATTDLAAVKHRVEEERADRILYVTDVGQSMHFEMVYKAAEAAGFVEKDKTQLKHVPFGLVQGEDGKKFKSRAGDTVKLKDLLDQAVEIAGNDMLSRLQDKEINGDDDIGGDRRTELTVEEKNAASVIGIGAVKYADLSMNRESNYRFSYKKMLSLSGNTAPYMLYAFARIQGIKRKASESLNVDLDGVGWKSILFTKPEELALAKALLKLDDILREIETELYPNKLCEYIFDLSQKFNQFYENCSVTKGFILSLF